MTTAPNVTIIPAKVQTDENRDKYHQLKVAAYCRVSTEQEEQQNSYQVQISYYTDLINRKKEWTLAGIFADEGISGTSVPMKIGIKLFIQNIRNIYHIISQVECRYKHCFSQCSFLCLQDIVKPKMSRKKCIKSKR